MPAEVPLEVDPIPSVPVAPGLTEADPAPVLPAVAEPALRGDDADAPTFAGLGLSQRSLAAVAAAGYTTPTPVQARAIPPARAGRDVIACAATGTGKTAAFVLPIVERLADAGRRGTRALVLAPTRELVQQICAAFAQFGKDRGVRSSYVVGGLSFGPQAKALSERRDVIVATPGRLLDHLDRGNVRLDGIEVLVLDEADRMLDLGFRAQLDAILGALPTERQTLLFSATIGRDVADFSRNCLRDPVQVQVVRSGTVAARAEQRVFHVDQRVKPDLLLALLAGGTESTLVFTRTKHRAERVAKVLERANHAVTRIHGDRSQNQRQEALEGFRSGRYRVLVATDVAARGLDIADIAHVVNFDLSLVAEDHVHRVGRTARAEASGLATSFCSAEETTLLRNIERFTRTAIPAAQVPDGVPGLPIPEPAAAAAAPSARRAGPPRRRPGGPPRSSHGRSAAYEDRRRARPEGPGRDDDGFEAPSDGDRFQHRAPRTGRRPPGGGPRPTRGPRRFDSPRPGERRAHDDRRRPDDRPRAPRGDGRRDDRPRTDRPHPQRDERRGDDRPWRPAGEDARPAGRPDGYGPSRRADDRSGGDRRGPSGGSRFPRSGGRGPGGGPRFGRPGGSGGFGGPGPRGPRRRPR